MEEENRAVSLFIQNVGTVIVNECDYLFTLSCQLRIAGEGYIGARVNARESYLHRLIAERAGYDTSSEIDHKNKNKLDCRRCNLRPATRVQNCQNTGKHVNNTSGVKGVDIHLPTGKWRARIRVNGKRLNLGLFDSLEKAEMAYIEAAKRFHKEFAS